MESTELARRRAREAHLSGTTPAQPGRTDIQASWRRVSAAGVDPHGHADIPPLTESEVHHRRSTTGLEGLLALLESSLEAVVDAGHLLVVSDAEGRVLWRRGRPPVQIQGSEHFVESHARWGCSAAPLRDPWTGQLLGVVDISGPRTATHPVLVSTVALAARLAELELLERHRQALDELRTASAHLLGGIDGPAAVIDPSGHVAASSGLVGHQIVSLPDNPQPGRLHLPGLGDVLLDPLPGGWLLRRDHEEAPATRAVLDLTAEPMIEVYAGSARWTRRLTPRHAELLVALVRVGQVGLRATELADAVFADPGRVVTIRAEMCRLRKTLGSLILARPYRLAPSVQVQTQWPLAPAVLLPGSSAPVVHATRRWLAQESGSARPRQT